MVQTPSIVEYFGYQQDSHCGYCKSDGPNKHTHGMWAHALSVEDYQDLLDRGWRRSGEYCYKPVMDNTCCPQYTIRCRTLEFKPSKSHKRVLRRMQNFVTTGQRSAVVAEAGDISIGNDQPQSSTDCDTVTDLRFPAPTASVIPVVSGEEPSKRPRQRKEPARGHGPDPTKPPCLKAKERRRLKKVSSLVAKGCDPVDETAKEVAAKNKHSTTTKSAPVSLEDLLSFPDAPALKLEFRWVLVNPPSVVFNETLTESHAVYFRYQTRIHRDSCDKPTEKQFRRFLCQSPLNVVVHKEELKDCEKDVFVDFLVESPLVFVPSTDVGFPGYGSFHQQYVLDGKIIAVAVLDILPSCVSSKYFYYDPEFQFLSLGVYSALREVALVRSFSKIMPNLQYYYMGYYVHTCPKMRYKGQYHPSDLLCPETFTWHPLEQCTGKLDVQKYARFEPDVLKGDEAGNIDVDSVLVLCEHTIMPYAVYVNAVNRGANDREEVAEYGRLIGQSCAERMLLFRRRH